MAWIIQEAILGKSMAVFCGEHILPWQVLAEAATVFKSTGLSLRASANEYDPDMGLHLTLRSLADITPEQLAAHGSAWTGALERLFGLWLLHNQRHAQTAKLFRELGSGFLARGYMSTPNCDLLFLMCYLSLFGATDPRDKAYAMLGLLNRMADSASTPRCTIRADYAKSNTPAVHMTEIVMHVVKDIGSPRHLELVVANALLGGDGPPS